MSLRDKKCVPCSGGMPPLSAAEAGKYLLNLNNNWEIIGNKKIRREFKFKDFTEAMAFANKVAQIAEAEDHHPDMHIFYRKVILELSTHAIGGLSENDFIVASKVDFLN